MAINNPSESNLLSTEKPAKKTATGIIVLDYIAVLAILVVLALLCANVWVIAMAKIYNDTCCRKAVESAAAAAITSKNAQGVMDAAKDALVACDSRFWPLQRPQFTQFRDERGQGFRQVWVQTKSQTAIPAPFLVPGDQFGSTMPLVLTSTYMVKFKDK